MSDDTITTDRSRLDAIKAKVRSARKAKGRLILALETVDRASLVPSWVTDLAYTTQVLVGRPAITSEWLSHPETIKEFGRSCHATGITRIADLARRTIETADMYPGERITMMMLGDCFADENENVLYGYAPLLRERGIRVIMGQDRPCEHGEPVYREMARLTDGTFIEPFTMNDPKEMEKVLVRLNDALTQVRIGRDDNAK